MGQRARCQQGTGKSFYRQFMQHIAIGSVGNDLTVLAQRGATCVIKGSSAVSLANYIESRHW